MERTGDACALVGRAVRRCHHGALNKDREQTIGDTEEKSIPGAENGKCKVY